MKMVGMASRMNVSRHPNRAEMPPESGPATSPMPRILERISHWSAGRPIGAKTNTAMIITISRKLVPQRGCSRE